MWSGVEWGTISLLGAIFAIGAVIARPETGIPAFITAAFKPLVQSGSLVTIICITVIWVVLQTNAMSNIVSETLVYNVMVPIMVAAKVGSAAALGAVISSASNQAFALPSATTTTAIVIGSGWVSAKFMAKYGAIMLIPTMLIFILVGYPLAALMFR